MSVPFILEKHELEDKTRGCPFVPVFSSFSHSLVVWSCDCTRYRARIYFLKCKVNYAKQFCGLGRLQQLQVTL